MCSDLGAPQYRANAGPLEVAVNVKNTSKRDGVFTLAHVGSWVRAYWKPSESSTSYEAKLGPDAAGQFYIQFSPGTGYEDLNLVYIMLDGLPVGEITVDYAIVNDDPLRTIELTTSGVQSGPGDGWTNYEIVTGSAPALFTVRKSCAWLRGDRKACGTNCTLAQTGNNLVKTQVLIAGPH